MPRQARIDYPGALNHIIGRGIERRAIFKKEADKSLFLKIIQKQLSKSSVQIYAWCIMDNHFHILLETGKTSLSGFMRRILTGYAVNYNKINKRSGHLFQNRYKSILCEKDEYLLPLIRYIHLNPVKAKVIGLGSLNRYKWTGNREIIQSPAKGIIAREEVLGYFGKTEHKAIESYKEYIHEGLELKEDYDGGGLIRSAGGLRVLLEKRRIGDRQLYDERMLGGGEFVEEVLNKVEEEEKIGKRIKGEEELIKRLAKYYGVGEDEIKNTRMKKVREARQMFIYLGYSQLGKTVTELGKHLGISQTAASKAMCVGRGIEAKKKIVESIAW